MAEENNVIYINDKEYDPSGFTDQQQYFLAQVNECQARTQQAQMAADREKAAYDTFVSSLIKSLEEGPEAAAYKEVVAN